MISHRFIVQLMVLCKGSRVIGGLQQFLKAVVDYTISTMSTSALTHLADLMRGPGLPQDRSEACNYSFNVYSHIL